ncbi:MAG: hypothetical protein AMXMBFR48_06010 [Ignavibacteriales bacterium]
MNTILIPEPPLSNLSLNGEEAGYSTNYYLSGHQFVRREGVGGESGNREYIKTTTNKSRLIFSSHENSAGSARTQFHSIYNSLTRRTNLTIYHVR